MVTAAVIIGIILLIVLVFMAMDNYPEFVYTNWHHYFPELQFSSQEFYDAVQKILQKREIPDTFIERIDFSERGGILGQKRVYLRVMYAGYKFDICAAPYGVGFFVSWWLGEDTGCLYRLLSYVPIYGAYLRRRMRLKTYYMRDVETMFQEAVRLAVLEAIDDITNEKGLRGLTELERVPIRGYNRI